MAKHETVTLNTGGIGLDLRDFAKFAKALRKSGTGLHKELSLRLRAAGEIVAAAARSNVSPYSTQVPASIKVRVSSATIAVVSGVGGVPTAPLFELGNKAGRGAASGYFIHPIFGRWVTGAGQQAMHPYLLPALHEHAEEAWAAAVEALDWAIEIAVLDKEL